MLSQAAKVPHTASSNPFDLANEQAYQVWRDQKMITAPRSTDELVVDIENLNELKPSELDAIRNRCGKANMAIYKSRHPEADYISQRQVVQNIGRSFGLKNLDSNIRADDGGISALHVTATENHHEYIPYSNRSINWHTDGYYNEPENKIRAMILHCVSPAASGGENALVDHEMLYLLMRDENPAYIDALMQEDVMTIPANIENDVELRAAQTGPVFSIDPQTGALHMRYTARTRSIEWKSNELVHEAVEFIKTFLNSASPYIFHHRLSAGEGIICNNVLHNRNAFEDDPGKNQERMIFRGRFYERIT
jgi:hypothetical protein